MKKIVFMSLLGIVTLSSCKKQLFEKYETDVKNSSQVKNFADLKVSENFDWKTNKAINFQYTGFKTVQPVKTTLTISSVDGKTVFYAGLQLMEENMQTKLVVPNTYTQILVTYGNFAQTFSTKSTQIIFSCLTVTEDEQ
jgi:hypothetical protein